MTDKREIRRYLWDSLEMGCLRRDAIFCSLLILIFMGANGAQRNGSFPFFLIVGILILLPFWCFWIVRTIRIFQRAEGYSFAKCQLTSPHQQPFLRGAMYFTVVFEDESGCRTAVDTHAIFQSHGIMGPLLEEYINRTVIIGYNQKTEMVVVIG